MSGRRVDNESETQREGVKGTVCLHVCVCMCIYIDVYMFCVGIGMSVRVYSMQELASERV